MCSRFVKRVGLCRKEGDENSGGKYEAKEEKAPMIIPIDEYDTYICQT